MSSYSNGKENHVVETHDSSDTLSAMVLGSIIPGSLSVFRFLD